MNSVKAFRLLLCDFQHFHGENIESGVLNHAEYVTDGTLLYRVGFNDAECALQRLHSFYESS
jgi:hypothetical protein